MVSIHDRIMQPLHGRSRTRPAEHANEGCNVDLILVISADEAVSLHWSAVDGGGEMELFRWKAKLLELFVAGGWVVPSEAGRPDVLRSPHGINYLDNQWETVICSISQHQPIATLIFSLHKLMRPAGWSSPPARSSRLRQRH